MARGSGWWSEPPWWAWAVMVAGAVFLAVGLPIALSRGQVADTTPRPVPPAAAETTAAETTAAGTTAAETTEAPEQRRLVAIGDSWTAAPDGGTGWPQLLGQRIEGLAVGTASVGDGGYVETDPSVGRTLGQAVEATALEDADVVVLAGSAFDGSGIADRVAVAAREAIAAVAARAPDAVVLVVGPHWPAADVPAGVRNNRDVIRAAAEAAGVQFVDPLAEGWSVETGDDGRPTDAGWTTVADRMQPLVEEALA
ncbi:GDSL-type esterase/lipase family protein [Geodermatophilus sp. SYSU D00691]